jgi:uncharacterized membrane protein (DUF2068 family)
MLLPLHKIDRHRAKKSLLRVVASFEVFKGVLGLVAGILAILLLHKDIWVIAESLLALLHISTDRRLAQLFLDFADELTDTQLWWAIKLAFVYAGLRFAEGYGLWKQRIWAEWIAFGSGMMLFPLEIRELVRGITWFRLGVFLINVGIVLYMGILLRDERRMQRVESA